MVKLYLFSIYTVTSLLHSWAKRTVGKKQVIVFICVLYELADGAAKRKCDGKVANSNGFVRKMSMALLVM